MLQGLPLHPLVVHFGVVLGLVAAGAVLVSAVLPSFRRWLGWGLPAVAVLGAVALRLTETFGELLQESSPRYDSAAVSLHEDWGERAALAGTLLAGASILVWVTTSPAVRARWTSRWPAWVRWAAQALAVVTALLTMVGVTLAGHTGATSVWGG